MYTIIILAVIGLVISMVVTANEYCGPSGDWVTESWMNWFLCAMLGAVIGFIVALAIPGKTYIDHSSVKIESLQDGSSTYGSFFLGIGTIQGQMKYALYYESDDGYRMAQLDYQNVSIKYTDGIPKLNIYEEKRDEGALVNKFSIDILENSRIDYVIEVPKGSIKNNFNLDAK